MEKPDRVTSWAASQTLLSQSSFGEAVAEFLKERKKPPKFIQNYLSGSPVTAEDVQETITQMEKDLSHKKFRRIIEPVVTVMVDYSGILDILCQADPMPSALVWGAMKVGIECFRRYVGLYTTIRNQLRRLSDQLERLTDYEELFGHSIAMQELLKDSYTNILRFWSKVEDECNRPGPVVAVRSLTSFSTSKLDDILASLSEDGDRIMKLVPIIQERLHKGERENAAEERRKAGIVRDELLAWVREQREERKQREYERKFARIRDIRQWLHGTSTLNESRQRKGESVLAPGSCTWLLKHPKFERWFDKQSSKRTLWLNASPGMGKSVLCAFAVQYTKKALPFAGVAYHYYSFDERVTSLTTYRNIAGLLFDQVSSQADEVSDHIHAIVKNRSDSLEIIKELIKLLVAELSHTYIFIDGLDEECTDPDMWSEASEVVDFFEDLASAEPSNVRLWCSSQPQPCVGKKLNQFPTIQMSEENNRSDIADYIAGALPMLEDLDIDPGTKALTLEDLRLKARGNFLWASLMVDTVSKATSFSDLQEQLHKGLPVDVEKYYTRKIHALPCNQRGLVCKILSCVVYAKRPLLLEELCEAIGTCRVNYGDDMKQGEALFKSKVLELCSPLVQIQETGPQSICSLIHASVRSFLVTKPRILYDEKQDGCVGDFRITNDELASICFKYLIQPRYKQLLKKQNDTFVTSAGEDINGHHLLSYAAKYWDKHLDDVEFSQEWCQRVERFIRSSQFTSCLQVQSLLVEGQFCFWLSSTSRLTLPHLRRVFPAWFHRRHHCGELLSRQYYAFVGEWGYLLDRYTNGQGAFAGEFDRCIWATLGPQNFLHNTPSQYKGFIFSDRRELEAQIFQRYFECPNANGSELQTVKLHRLKSDRSQIQVICQRWTLANARRPVVKHMQDLKVATRSLALYDSPLRNSLVGRPPPVSFAADLRFLRIGTQLFVASETGDFIPLIELHEDLYSEEIASNGRFVASASRRRVSWKDFATSGLDDLAIEDFEKMFTDAVNSASSEASQMPSRSTATPSSGDPSSNKSSSSSQSANSSATSLNIEENPMDDILPGEIGAELEEDSAEELSSIASNSARESWSEGSTTARSDNLDDEDQWNDWNSADDDLEIKDIEELSVNSSDAESRELKVENKIDDASDTGSEAILGELNRSRSSLASDVSISDSDDGIESEWSQTQDSEDEDEDEDGVLGGGTALEALIQSRGRTSDRTMSSQRGRLQIFDTDSGTAVPLFRYEQTFPNILFSSPPIFHPTASLIVWPLGSGEILFADFSQNTFFTRTLRCSAPRSCHVFIKSNFSLCGTYLHLAALEARQNDNPTDSKPPLKLTLQVSTHRLSRGKPSRSPPKLIFRTTVLLGESASLSVSRLPYTLTWTPKELYLTESSLTLKVFRIPLFNTSKTANEPPKTLTCTNPVFLPASATARALHYFPPSPTSSGSSPKNPDLAHVILSSLPRSINVMPYPPMGFYLDEKTQMGGWKELEADGEGMEEGLGAEGNGNRGGRLQGKFERFDRTEDCDIVPYLC